MTFIPPPVEPAQPPIKLESTNKTGKNNGQSAKEVVVKPAVVEIETDWNNACEKEVSIESYT